MENWEGEVVGETDGGVVGWFKRIFFLGKRMDPSLEKMWNGCEMGSFLVSFSEVTKLMLSAHAH